MRATRNLVVIAILALVLASGMTLPATVAVPSTHAASIGDGSFLPISMKRLIRFVKGFFGVSATDDGELEPPKPAA